MGLFDTIHFNKPIICKTCGGMIKSVQVKDFAQTLSSYYEKDCIGHAEDIRILKEEVSCPTCSNSASTHVYIPIVRGIIVGVTESFEEAQRMLQDLNLEKLTFWYHDLFRRYRLKDRELSDARGFMQKLVEWYEEGRHTETEADSAKRILPVFLHEKYLKNEQNPVDAIKKYLVAHSWNDKEMTKERIRELAKEVMDDDKMAEEWLNAPAFVLGNKKPVDLWDTKEGAQLVIEALYRIEYGIGL